MSEILEENQETVTAKQLLSFIERIERLEEEKNTINTDIKQVYLELKGNGFDAKAVKTIIALRKKEADVLQQEEETLKLYRERLGI
ncbi:DUF2312 domain-containing protein [Bartonella sp. DGB1]|uniref:DUF2312 domain-containing protein n=1 Tax=Bartonella sp. DGB1 TaxID=3239807 RepID=UPI0035266F2C